MKNRYRFLILLFFLLLLLPSSSLAVKVKLRMDILPLGASRTIQGLDSINSTGGFGLGLGLLFPFSRDIYFDTGYEYNNVSFTDALENYKGSYSSHYLQIGGSYTAFQVTETYSLIVGSTLDLPISGSAEVTRQSDGSKASSSSLGGWGIYTNGGLTDGEWDFYLFFRQRTQSYGLIPPGQDEKLKWTTTVYGLGLGYTF